MRFLCNDKKHIVHFKDIFIILTYKNIIVFEKDHILH